MTIGCRPYSEEVLRDLRIEFGQTHVFKRDGLDNAIIEIPVAQGVEPLSDTRKEIDLKECRRYWGPLLNAALIRTFHGKREIARDYPVEILGSANRNYVSHVSLPEWLQKRSLLQFIPRTLYSPAGKALFGLLCDARTRNLVLASCKELLNRNISPVGRYVLVDRPARDPRVAAWPQNVGRVGAVEGDTLLLEDHREGMEKVPAAEARLNGSRVDFDWCVRRIAGPAAEGVLSKAEGKAARLHSGPGRLKMINDALNFLRTQTLEPVPGARFQIDELLDSKQPNFPFAEMIAKPSLVFDPSGIRTDSWSERGIKRNGPYNQRTFTPKKLNIAIICQARYEGQVEAFVAKFLDGMPDTKTGVRGWEVARYADGFLR
ncbi:MAG: hypothetical protein OXF68_07725 [Gammaproteobacteria bacterium]|nr:hypothetical protein [Gammaproteobacteria bacterium]